MNAFYKALKAAEKSRDVRLSTLSLLCKADVKDIREHQLFSDWDWWAG